MILELIQEKSIGTQGALVRELARKGFRVDQATVSRDIKELGLIKIPEGERYRYSAPEDVTVTRKPVSRSLITRMILSTATSNNLIVIKTDPGNASAVALAIDLMKLPEILGTIAGDDTLIAIVQEKKSAKKVLQKMMEEARK